MSNSSSWRLNQVCIGRLVQRLLAPGAHAPCEFKVAKNTLTGRKMSNEGNNALSKSIHERLSLAECELLCTLARGVPVGQVIVSLSGGEDEAATWLARGVNEVTDGKVHSLNMRDVDCEEKSRRCKEKIGLWWYNASCKYEDVRKAFLCWQRHLSSECWIILRGHDQPGVARVIKEFTGSYGNFGSGSI